MTKPIENSTAHSFYEIVKSFERNSKLDINDIIRKFLVKKQQKFYRKLTREVIVEYKLDDNSTNLNTNH